LEKIEVATIIQKIRENKKIIQSFGIEKIGIFGSYAKVLSTENSDIDILVKFKDVPVRTYEYFGLKFYLPYANVELASFWYRTPTRYRIERNLFRKYLNKYAYKDEYKFLLDIPIALGKRTDDKFIELNDTDKMKIIIKYHLMGTSIAKFLKKLLKKTIMKEHIKKRNLQIDYVGFYDFFKDKDFEFDICEKNYHQLIGMYGIKSIKRNKN